MNQNLFESLPIDPQILRAIGEMGFSEPTPIQSQSIPLILEGHDVVGRSQTGTGKTAAFGIPAIQMVDPHQDRRLAQVLLLCPTRELAVQACEELKKLSRYLHGVRTCAVYGGAPIERQIVQLKDANIIVGTPGRVMDHLRRRTLKLDALKLVILDEADEMLSMGFREDIETILTQAPAERQTVLFSATMPQEIMKLIDNYQKDPQLVEINKSQVALNSIEQSCYDIPTGRKNDALALLLHYYQPSRAIVFCNTKRMVEELSSWLIDHGFKAEGLHGDLKQSQRTVVMDAFKAGRTSLLIATDVAARGIDVDDINCVFNYDIPQNAEYYVHRIGRTGRAGKSGSAFTLCCGRFQLRQMEQIARIARADVQQRPVPMPEEIRQKQNQESADTLRALLSGKEEFPYLTMVQELLSAEDGCAPAYTAEQLAAAALELLYGSRLQNLPDARGINRENKRRSPRDYVKLMLDVGHNVRIVPNFIVGAIAERTALSGRDIGKIEIFEDNTTVEIPQEQAEEVLAAMQDCRINGHKVSTSVLKSTARQGNPRKGSTDSERSHRGGQKGAQTGERSFRGKPSGGYQKGGSKSGHAPHKKSSYADRFASYDKKSDWKADKKNDKKNDWKADKKNDKKIDWKADKKNDKKIDKKADWNNDRKNSFRKPRKGYQSRP